MTALRRQCIDLLHTQGLSSHTETMYGRAVRQLAEFYNLSPDRLSDEQIHQYLRHLRDGKQLAGGSVQELPGTMNVYHQTHYTNCLLKTGS